MDSFFRIVITIFDNMLKLAQPLIDFLSIEIFIPDWYIPILNYHIPGGTYSLFAFAFGAGLPIVLGVAVIKFLGDSLPG